MKVRSDEQGIEKPQHSSSKAKRYSIIICAFAVVLMIGASLGIMISAQSPSGIPTVIEPGSMADTSTYIIFKDAATTYAKNGTTGAIDFSSDSSYSVIQSCLNKFRNDSLQGGSIYLKLGTYAITTVLNITQRNLKIDAEKGTILTGTILPIMQFIGKDFEVDFANIYAGIEISNIDFYYTGPITTGNFIFIKKAQPDNTYGTAFYVHDLKIHSNAGTWPSDTTFVGLALEDIIGLRFERLQIYQWGVGIDFLAGMNAHWAIPEDSEHIYFGHMDITECHIGVYEHSTGGNIFFTTWDTVKINQIDKTAMYSIDQNSVMNMPDFGEFGTNISLYISALELVGAQMTITGGQIVSARDVLINMTNSHLSASQMRLFNSHYAFWNINGYLEVNGNSYSGITTLIHSDTTYVFGTNDQIETVAMGTVTVTGATNSVTVATNLVWWPWQVLVTEETQNGSGGFWISSKGGSQGGDSTVHGSFVISFENQPGASTWRFDWWATCSGSI